MRLKRLIPTVQLISATSAALQPSQKISDVLILNSAQSQPFNNLASLQHSYQMKSSVTWSQNQLASFPALPTRSLQPAG
eukprot:1157422-Pelagomonas_calceolata.AAC.2